MAGFGCFWAWVDNAFFTAVLYQPPSSDALLSTTHLGAIIVAIIITLCVLIKRQVQAIFSRRLLFTVATCAALASLLLFFAGQFEQQLLLVPALVFGGVGMAFICLAWGVIAAELGTSGAGVCMPGVIFFSALFGLVIKGMLFMLSVVITTLIPLVSVCLLLLFKQSCARDQAEEGARQTKLSRMQSLTQTEMTFTEKLPIKFFIILFIFCAAFGLMQYLLVLPEKDADFISRNNILFRGLIALVFLIGIGVFQVRPTTMYKAGFMLMIAGFLVVPFVGQTAVTSAIIMMGYTCFDMLAWIVICTLGNTWRKDTTRIVALSRLASLGGVLAGALGVTALLKSAALGQIDVAVITTAITYLLVTATALSMDQSPAGFWSLINAPSLRSDTPSQEALGTAVDQIANEYSLTQREQEFFSYLASGRSIPWICSHLRISDGTGRSHARHIYAKLQVHSRQQLMDFVEMRISNH
jgi:DNA-binding CsgD family transcriptional regulator